MSQSNWLLGDKFEKCKMLKLNGTIDLKLNNDMKQSFKSFCPYKNGQFTVETVI